MMVITVQIIAGGRHELISLEITDQIECSRLKVKHFARQRGQKDLEFRIDAYLCGRTEDGQMRRF